jgi:pimeloyl-ACP methyl ester carboxylesterase
VTRAMAEELQHAIPASRLLIFEGLGHSPNLADPDRFVAALLESLATKRG